MSKECRLCLRHEQNCVSLFAKRRGTTLAEIVRFCARVEISKDDGLPVDACGRCVDEALNAYLFVNKCRRSDAELRTAQANFRDDDFLHFSQDEGESESNDKLTFSAVLDSDPEAQPIESVMGDSTPIAEDSTPIDEILADVHQVVPYSDVAEKETFSSTNEDSSSYNATDIEKHVEINDQQDEKVCEEDAHTIEKNDPLCQVKQETVNLESIELEDENTDQPFMVEYLDDNYKDDFTEAIEAECMQYEVEALEESETGEEVQLLICCGVRCKIVFNSIEDMKKHSETVHLPHRELENKEKLYECKCCYTRFNSEKSLTMHSRKSQHCTICSQYFSSLKERRLHMHKVHGHSSPVTEKQSSQRICCGCYEEFSSDENLKLHGEAVHSIRKSAVDETKPYQCNICYKLFRTFESLRIHQRFVYRPKNFVCSLCGRAFDTRSKLQTHELVHSDKRNFQCEKCSKSFKKEIDLKSHSLLHEEKREECSFCGLKFHRKSNLKMHMRKHQDTFFYACSECPRKFKNNSHLKEHFKVHSKQKPYPCSFCDRSFAYSSDRKRHEMTHTGNYPFECGSCLKKFSRKTTYEKHMSHCQEGAEEDYRD
ncbi:oocyte zinc finger protein XlCOF6-like [Armigeres subalbatus]|uniref:oocyte zinc finger protein XlCOF6-like n=1 Tax=Armigeres subalbatus TaxID=124917 RepID=UPI002ED42C21